MTAIVTSLLGGGWALVAGWILPTALNSVFFAFLVLPGLRSVPGFHVLVTASHPAQALVLFVTAVVAGLMLSALQTPLYRTLEGYNWPGPVRRRRIGHYKEVRDRLESGLRLARLARREQDPSLTAGQAAELARLRAAGPRRPGGQPGRPPSAVEVSLLAERLRRYPVDPGQILPTRLGNAIRRFEEYGYDRYRLDIVTMWHALYGVSADQVRKDVDAGRASVDFFVCLIYGHALVVAGAIAALAVSPGHPAGPVAAIVAAVVLSACWYGLAIRATDEWAAAVRGLVDLGRKPLADALGLDLPATTERERQMWTLVSRRGRRPYSSGAAALDPFRSRPQDAAADPGDNAD